MIVLSVVLLIDVFDQQRAAQALKVALQKIVDRLAKDVMELTSQGRVNALSIEADIARQKKRVRFIKDMSFLLLMTNL